MLKVMLHQLSVWWLQVCTNVGTGETTMVARLAIALIILSRYNRLTPWESILGVSLLVARVVTVAPFLAPLFF